jgi:hypothetical protein
LLTSSSSKTREPYIQYRTAPFNLHRVQTTIKGFATGRGGDPDIIRLRMKAQV